MIRTLSKVRDTGFRFVAFSKRQKQVLTWWTDSSPYKDHNGIIADGSIRAGKTLTMAISFVMWAMTRFNGKNFGICGKTIGSLRRNVINDLKRTATSRGYVVEDRRGDNMLIIRRGSVCNLFYLFGGRDESSQNLVQGITLAGCLFDEVALMPESFVNQATARCSVEGAKLWFNCNPDGRLHWFKINWINKYRKNKFLYIHFTMDDNPSLSEATKARYRGMYVGVFFRRYIEGLWVAAEGLIYDMWDEELNSFDYDPDNEPWARAISRHYVAVDFGMQNPTAFLEAWDDGKTFWCVNEYYHDSRASKQQKTAAQYADDFDTFVGGDHTVRVIVDPSAEVFSYELRNRGYIVIDADNEVIEGIRLTATMIYKRRVRVARHLRYFRREISTYVWDQKAALHGEEKPVKEKDHILDAIRYLIKTNVTKSRLMCS